MSFSVENLIAKVDLFNSKQLNKGYGNLPNVAFLPNGKHRGRIIVDSNGEVFACYSAYGYFNKGVRDPRYLPANELPAGFVDELASVAKTLADRGKYQYKAKDVFLILFYLEYTDSPSEKWSPGNYYYVVCNKTFGKSLTAFLGSIAKENPNAIQSLLNPSLPGNQIEINFRSGKDGACNVGATFPAVTSKEVDLTQSPYVSFDEAYIKPEFDLNKYNALLETAKLELEKTPAKSEKEGVNNANEFVAQPKAQTFTNGQGQVQQATRTENVVNQAPPQTFTNDNQAHTQGSGQVEAMQNNDPWAKFKQQA